MIRKVFMATINYDHPQSGMIHAFEGVFGRDQVRHYDYLTRLKETGWGVELVNNELVDQAVEFEPDWVWLQLQNTNVIAAKTLERLRERLPKAVVTHWMGDIRSEVGEYLGGVCRATHVTFTSSIGYLPLYEAAGAKTARYLQIGLDWNEDVLGLPEWTPPFQVPDVVFCGNFYNTTFPGYKEREQAVRALVDAGIGVGVVGDGWGGKGLPVLGRCGVKQQVQVWRRAKVCLSVNHFPDVAGYYSDRHLTALVSGTPVCCRYIPLLEREFQDGVNLMWWRDEAELVQKVRQLLADDGLRQRIGRAGRAEAIRNHTWFSRITTALPVVEEVRVGL